MSTEPDRAVCNVCGRWLRPQEVEHCDGGCALCFDTARGPQPCVCGHDAREHFDTFCNHTYVVPMTLVRVECDCAGFDAKEEAA